MILIKTTDQTLFLPVRVTPRGGRDCILPFQPGDSVVKIKVACPPEDGKANASVIAILAHVLGIAKSRVAIHKGEKSREKQIAISLNASDPTEWEALLTVLAVHLGSEPAVCFQVVG